MENESERKDDLENNLSSSETSDGPYVFRKDELENENVSSVLSHENTSQNNDKSPNQNPQEDHSSETNNYTFREADSQNKMVSNQNPIDYSSSSYLEKYWCFFFVAPIFITFLGIVGMLVRIGCEQITGFGPDGTFWLFANIMGSFIFGMLAELKAKKLIYFE